MLNKRAGKNTIVFRATFKEKVQGGRSARRTKARRRRKIFLGLFICSYASFRDFNDEIINILKQYFCNRV